MRLRDLTPEELADVAARRARVASALGSRTESWVPSPEAIALAPFLDAWELRPYPGTEKPCLKGLCWGHPVFGDTVVNTSIIAHCGQGWAITEGSGRLYVLGREDREPRPSRVLSGRRGAYRPVMTAPPTPSLDSDADLPPLQAPKV